MYGHCTIDTITVSGKTHTQIGGSACYCSAMARRLGFDAHMVTRFGPDFPRDYLDQNDITYSAASESASGTTRFSLDVRGVERDLRLDHRCDDILYEQIKDAECRVISPLCGEISHDTLKAICADSGFVLVDPQGFLRHADSRGAVALGDGSGLDLSGADAIKVSADEAQHLTGGLKGDAAMEALRRRGADMVLYTDGAEISLLSGDKVYSITLPNKRICDTTGIGDMFCAAFCCTLAKERDVLWALCFAGGAAQAALDSKDVGLLKVPRKGSVQTNASYFYNIIKFRGI